MLESLQEAICKGEESYKELIRTEIDRLEQKINNQEAFEKRNETRTTPIRMHPQVFPQEGDLALRPIDIADYEGFSRLFRETEGGAEGADDEVKTVFDAVTSALYCAIVIDGSFAGYCGIKNGSCDPPELAIELLKSHRSKGYGYRAMKLYLDMFRDVDVKNENPGESRNEDRDTDALPGIDRVEKYRVLIDSDNVASQRLFEKLGASLTGLAEYMFYTEEEQGISRNHFRI